MHRRRAREVGGVLLLSAVIAVATPGLAVGQEAERPVVAKARRGVLAFAPRELHRGPAVCGHAPQVAHVLCPIAVEPLAEIPLVVVEPHTHEWHAKVGRALDVVAGNRRS